MDPMGIAGMLFTLILAAMVGGFILLFPVSRRLGAYLEQRLKGHLSDDRSAAEIRRLESAVRAMQEELERISERQTFTESLLEDRERLAIPASSETERRSPS